MSIEPDAFNPDLRPARDSPYPLVAVQQLLAINTVHLNAGKVPARRIRHFYTQILGLEHVGLNPGVLEFRHGLRRVVLGPPQANNPFPKLALSATYFSDILKTLSSHSVPYEILRYDGGLSRAAILKDPAGNWVHLMESRPF